MRELSESHIEKIIVLLEKGKPILEHYKEALISDIKRLKTSLLFDTKKKILKDLKKLWKGMP
jgi:hypothetical protein